MSDEPTAPNDPGAKQTYEIAFRYAPRLVAEHLGSLKYTTPSRALGELVANALAAGATEIAITAANNDLGGMETITVTDNGKGMTPAEIKTRFAEVGVAPVTTPDDATQLGRFGVGRFAVYRLGTVSDWTTTARDGHGKLVRSNFTLRSQDPGHVTVKQEHVVAATPTGSVVTIANLLDADKESLNPSRIQGDLLTQYCAYLIAHPKKRITVQGELLDVAKLIESREDEIISEADGAPGTASLHHLLLRKPLDQTRFPEQLLFSAKGRTVVKERLEEPPAPQYLGLVDCPYLDTIVTSNREALIDLDDGFSRLRSAAIKRVHTYAEAFRANRKRAFIERARREEYYPYTETSTDPVATVQQAVYDVVLEKINEHANIEGMAKKQQAVVFRLLQRAMSNQNLIDILAEVAKLSDADIESFRKVLERTTLDSIIRLSSEVTSRLHFLDILHELVYGDLGKHLKERTQLHRILEPHAWLFGTQFHLATSDRSFRDVLRRHRSKAKLSPVPEDDIQSIEGIADIPDLFLAASRDFPVEPQHHHLIVEIKAPSVTIGTEEESQIRRYANTILDSPEFDKTSTHWDLFLVSAKASPEIQRQRHQKDKPHGRLYDFEGMNVWAFEWSEIITKARDEMRLVRDHLQQKSKELSVSTYLRENFPEILQNLTATATSTPATPPPRRQTDQASSATSP